jgi:hypothetical protein
VFAGIGNFDGSIASVFNHAGIRQLLHCSCDTGQLHPDRPGQIPDPDLALGRIIQDMLEVIFLTWRQLIIHANLPF